jgi:hypothetical protein
VIEFKKHAIATKYRREGNCKRKGKEFPHTETDEFTGLHTMGPLAAKAPLSSRAYIE